MNSTTTVGPRELEARDRYTAGSIAWDAVLSAREEDGAAARANAEREARQQAEREAAEEAARAKETAEREAREATERTRREAPLRKRVAEIEAELSKLAIAPKDLDTLVRFEVARHRIAGRLDAERERRKRLHIELRGLRGELGLHAPPADEQAQLAIESWSDRIAVVVGAALKATSWADLQAKIPRTSFGGVTFAGNLPPAAMNASFIRALVDALAGEKGAPDLRPKAAGMFERRALKAAREATLEAERHAEEARAAAFAASQASPTTANRRAAAEALERSEHARAKLEEARAAERKVREEIAAKGVDVAAFDAGEGSS